LKKKVRNILESNFFVRYLIHQTTTTTTKTTKIMKNYTLEVFQFENGQKMEFQISTSLKEACQEFQKAYEIIIPFMQENKLNVVENVRQGKCSIYFNLTNLKRCYLTLKKTNSKK
jgi:hypothetical protein